MKIFKRKKSILAAAVSAVVVIMALLCKPGDRGGGYDDYFGAMNSMLKESRISQPVIVLDLDRMDSNIDLLLKAVKHPLKYRIVIKSLPSPDMLMYIMNRTGSTRLMPFHLSHMRAIMELGIPGLDLLPGIPFPVAAVESFYDSLPAARRAETLRAVQWLIDSEDRLSEYLDFAVRRGIRLRVNIEIDVGLRRGGAGNPAGLSSLLSIIVANREHLVFSGFMGYDGHVTHVPIYIGSKESAIRREFAKVMNRYREFIESGRREFPALFSGELTFNGGGSTTYPLYDQSSPANDIAAGSCLVMPATFNVFTLEGHRAALFMAAPVLKKILNYSVPFIEFLYGFMEWWDPNSRVTFYTMGGGWSNVILAPAGVSENALAASPPNENMLPNQSMLNGSDSVRLDVGDFIFYHPFQGDAIMQFNEVLVLRGGRITARWRPFAARI